MILNTKKIKTIYNRLGDDKSKIIFENRLMFSCVENYSFINNIIKTTVEGNTFLQALSAAPNRKKMIFGAGWWGKNILKNYPDIGFEGFVDNNVREQKCLGLPVFSFEDYIKKYKDNLIVVSPRLHHEKIVQQLMNSGIKTENIINFAKLEESLAIRAYFDLPALEKARAENEFFIDAGAFDGMTSRAFIDWAGGKYIGLYAFEPDRSNIKKVHMVLDKYLLNKRGMILEKGLWNKTTTLHFMEGGGALSKIIETGDINVSPVTSFSRTAEISVCSIDDICKDEEITFIKMDIEGSEYEALCGAEKTIKNHKPKLAISVYHKPDDLWKLPEKILDLSSDYIFYLRHYSLAGEDTVLYAIPNNDI